MLEPRLPWDMGDLSVMNWKPFLLGWTIGMLTSFGVLILVLAIVCTGSC